MSLQELYIRSEFYCKIDKVKNKFTLKVPKIIIGHTQRQDLYYESEIKDSGIYIAGPQINEFIKTELVVAKKIINYYFHLLNVLKFNLSLFTYENGVKSELEINDYFELDKKCLSLVSIFNNIENLDEDMVKQIEELDMLEEFELINEFLFGKEELDD